MITWNHNIISRHGFLPVPYRSFPWTQGTGLPLSVPFFFCIFFLQWCSCFGNFLSYHGQSYKGNAMKNYFQEEKKVGRGTLSFVIFPLESTSPRIVTGAGVFYLGGMV